MSDMTIKEIEDHLRYLDMAANDEDYGIHSATANLCRASIETIRQLLNAQKWREIDDDAKQGVVLIGDNEKFAKAAIWDEAKDAKYPWKFFDADGTINRAMAEYVTVYRPLPSPPQEKENGDA